jgi:hypothetical protein
VMDDGIDDGQIVQIRFSSVAAWMDSMVMTVSTWKRTNDGYVLDD